MQITIPNNSIDRIDENGVVVAKIPDNTFYLYLAPKDIIERGTDYIRADIDGTRNYAAGPKEPNYPKISMQGYRLMRHFIPEEDMAAKTQQQQSDQPARPAEESTNRTEKVLDSRPAEDPEVQTEQSSKIIISTNIVERVNEDGSVVSRIPGMNQYLYLKPEDIIAQDEYAMLADIKHNQNYTVGSKDPNKPAALMRGETLSGHYEYNEEFDPQLKQEIKANEAERKQRLQQQRSQAKQQTTEQKQAQTQKQAPMQNQSQPEVQNRQSVMNQKYTKEQFRQLKLGQKHHLNISSYWNIHLSGEQMKQLRLMQENGVDIAKLGYNNPSVKAEVLGELRLCHKAGYSMNDYDWQHMDEKQLREIRLGIEKHLDVSQYAYSTFSNAQMKQLRLGLQGGFDISSYRNPHFTEKQMYSLRCSQVFERLKEKLRALFDSVKQFFRESSLMQIRAAVMDKITQNLDKAVEALSREEAVQGAFRNQEVPEVTIDDRIQETVQDIKEMLVAQELVPEDVLYDMTISEQMDTQIRQALDSLMQPENIQNMEKQEQIISDTAETLLQETGAELPQQEQHQGQHEADLSDPWENLTDKEKMDMLGEEMSIEEQMMLEAQAEQGMVLER